MLFDSVIGSFDDFSRARVIEARWIIVGTRFGIVQVKSSTPRIIGQGSRWGVPTLLVGLKF